MGEPRQKWATRYADFVDEPEKASPVGVVYHKLAEIEIEDVEDEASLTMLKDAGRGIDTALSDTAAQKIDTIAGRNSAKDIRTEDRGKAHLRGSLPDTRASPVDWPQPAGDSRPSQDLSAAVYRSKFRRDCD